jgi:hypothetical protein
VARGIVDTLVRAAPGIHADSTQYPPSFEKQLRAAEEQLKKLPLRKLTVLASAPGARVFVDGREVGTAPVTLALPAGRYRVSGRLGESAVPRVPVDLTKEDGQTVTLNFAVAEALRPSWGPGLALAEGNRQGPLITAGAFLGLDKLLSASITSQDEVSYLVGAFYDVRRGMLLRQGLVRLNKGSAAPGSIAALASFLITGQTTELVAAGGAVGGQPPQPAPPPKIAAASPAGRAAAAPPRAPSAAVPRAGAAPAAQAKPAAAKPSKALGWAAVGAGVVALGLGGVAVYEGVSANGSYNNARGLLEPNSSTLQSSADPGRFKSYVSDGDSAKTMAYVFAGAAVATAVVAGVLFVLAQ